MKSKYFFIIFILGLFLIPFVTATCTVTFDKSSNYTQGETVVAQMSCSEVAEKNDDYILNWTNATGSQIELDTGTTPSQVNTNFFEIFVIPLDYVTVNGTNITATLQNGDLEGSDTENISEAGTNDLIITEIGFTDSNDIRLGKTLGIEFEVDDEKGKEISNAQCEIDLEDGIGNPLMSKEIITHAGKGDVEFLLQPETFMEDRGYLVAIRCFCGLNTTSLACIDEDGLTIGSHVGNVDTAFDIVKWLTINTVVDKSIYEMRNTLFICANISNNHTERINLHIFHQVRCSKGLDSESDLDRTLIISDGTDYDERGVSANSTQMQCKEFLVPEIRHLEGRNSQCYASTTTWVMNEKYVKVKGYPTTSSVFNITSNTINVPADWLEISADTFNTIINLSESQYSDWNASGTGTLGIVLDSRKGEEVDAKKSFSLPPIDFYSFMLESKIKNITVRNVSGSILTSRLGYLKDGKLEIEVPSADISPTGYYNVTIVFETFEERQTDALEGIENKTGTFHLDVNCPSSGTIGSDIACVITAYVEDSQTVQKEVDFTCYISDGTNSHSSTNFNQMITRNAVSLSRTFAVPSSFSSGTQYVLQCHADYYNLGSRRDSFYDTFTASSSSGGGGSSGITGRAVDEGDEDKDRDIGEFNPFSPKRNWAFMFMELIILISLIALIYSYIKKRRRERRYYHGSRKNWKKILGKIFLILLGIIILAGIIAGIIYGCNYVKRSIFNSPEESSDIIDNQIEVPSQFYSILQDSLFRGIILTAFIILMIVILFKALNLRGELKFGHDYSTRRYHEDRKSAKMQQKLNQIMLKNEIKRETAREDYKVRKMTPKEFTEFVKKKNLK